MQLATEPPETLTRIHKAYLWWTSPEVMDGAGENKGPSDEQWAKVLGGLKQLSETDGAPECIRTAFIVACDPSCRTWGWIEHCFYTALEGKVTL